MFQETCGLSIPSTQIDFQLVKIYARINSTTNMTNKLGTGRGSNSSNSSGASSALAAAMMSPMKMISKTGTIMKVSEQQKKKMTHDSSSSSAMNINHASFLVFVELLKSIQTLSFTSTNTNTTTIAASSSGSIKSNNKGSITSTTTLTCDEIVQQLYNYLNKNDLYLPYHRYSLEYKVSISGILTRSCYAQYIRQYANNTVNNVPEYTEGTIDLVRQIWERNAEQIRQIYSFYAITVETRRNGSGPLKLLLSIDQCKEMLQDFQLLPQVIDVTTFQRLYRSCKLWEWDIGEMVMHIKRISSSPNSKQQHRSKEDELMSLPSSFSTITNGNGNGNGGGGHRTVANNTITTITTASALEFDPQDPFDFKGSIGHFALSLW